MSEVQAISQTDLDRLEECPSKNRMKCNKVRCKVQHLGLHNQKAQHRLGSVWLGSSLAEGDLGVLVDNKLNMSQQCNAAPRQANGILGCTCKGITSRDSDGVVPLYPALVRPHLKCCVKF